MARRYGMRAMQAGAAAACAAAAFGALAQGALTPQAVVERAQSTGVIAGLQRALSTPLEVVWLRTAAELETWDRGELAGATVGRTGWRYIFGGTGQFAPAPNEVARLVVSSLSLPKAPMSAGKLELAGSGRLFVISPEAPGRAAPEQVALVLAAGSTLQVSDSASPALQIEIKAPGRSPLLLGNLASANVRRMLALLVKPGAVSASAASLKDGKVALRTGGELELATIVDGRARTAEPPVALAASFDTPVPPAEVPAPIAVAVEASPIEQDIRPAPPTVVAAVVPTISAPIDIPKELAPEEPVAAKPAPVEVAVIPLEPALAPIEPLAPVEEISATVVPAPVIPVEAPKELAPEEPAEAKPIPVQTAAVPPEAVVAPVEPPAAAAPIEETPVATPTAPPAPPQETPIVATAPVIPAEAPKELAAAKPAPAEVAAIPPEPVVIAAIPAKPIIAIVEASPPSAKTPQQAASIERMRAEIDAEIARDRERLAHQRELSAPAKRFVLGV